MFKIIFIGLIIIVFACPYAFSAADLSEKIIELRNEVSQLSDDFKTEKELLKSKIQTLALEKMDLDSKIRRQNLQVKDLNDKLIKAKSIKIIKHPEFDDIILTFLEFEQKRLNATIPYKFKERTDHIKNIKNDFLEEKVSSDKLLQTLWTHVEDEIQLAKDISVDKDILNIDGQSTLVEVAKVGMLMLFYKTSNGNIGYMEYSNGVWSPRTINSSGNILLVENFFDSLKKQVRTGYFEFPKIPFKQNFNDIKQNAKTGDKNDNV